MINELCILSMCIPNSAAKVQHFLEVGNEKV